ncbi:polysaccharide biosynthesis/export family protein [Leeuwenhoekiella marinoflava]|uniref:polysaccharide biosynthesis/export family protein n=1 Tax=Leeuwenhoekiella marinoflava TaxID=988 RepID=UPI0030033EEB
MIKATSLLIIIFIALTIQSCASKKEILYFQDGDSLGSQPIDYKQNTIQPNDILAVTIGALVNETATAYNKPAPASSTSAQNNLEILKLQGYLVDIDGVIKLPVLGKISTTNKTIRQLERYLNTVLEEGGHLVNPSVSVRLLNAKVTILGEVNNPGTFTFTEQYITIPQALGYAGDLKINGIRKDLILIREVDGIRNISHIDLTTSNWMNENKYIVKPNDVILVNPNNAKVKTAGYIGNASTVLTLASLILSSVVLLTR